LPEILGIGTDSEEISRFHKHVFADKTVSPLITELFTTTEIRRNLSFKNPYLCFTLGFSCKESVFKALGRSWMNAPIAWNEIECLFEEEPSVSVPDIRLSGGAMSLFNEAGGKEVNGAYEFIDDHVIFRVVIWK
jgi:phosphopantetheine--protein transferase-like protein